MTVQCCRRACNTENDSECCVEGKYYGIYKCLLRVSGRTKAVLTINSFEKGGDGGAESECDNNYHSDDTPVVALSTGAMVVDECDSTTGCDADHDYQPPCPQQHRHASKTVWKALGVPKNDWGEIDIYRSDA
ncbi:unnamed protein product [Ilex paraguariensis]|uniref:Uncharacterized protein n=1 Tax=Ilex paraguariensis TaxID=185542 RepID=A0ABC8QST7_9AQUA